MRIVFAFGFLFLSATILHAQEQEKKLLDRLLKPDTSLQNEAQGKQFTPAGATMTKTARTKSFFVAERKAEKGFWNTRQVPQKEFGTESSRYANAKADLNTRGKLAKVDSPYPANGYGDVHDAVDAKKSAATSDYPGNRAFIPNGKSQKSLKTQDRPLTIDQVRELLNKNK